MNKQLVKLVIFFVLGAVIATTLVGLLTFNIVSRLAS
jgi:uncharacterized membrane protein YuzA (DUF378 family)